jgi:Domain of unknown function (DUF4177)
MKEYKVIRDISMKGDNNPEALEKAMNDLGGQGWTLAEAVTFAAGAAQKMYFVFEREKGA